MAAGSPGALRRRPAPGRETARTSPPLRLRHDALFHGGGAEGFAREAVPLVERALRVDAPVLVATAEDRLAALRERLGGAAARVTFAEIRSLGANPARIIPAMADFLHGLPWDGPEPLAVVEAVWAERSADELEECRRHERLLPLAFSAGRRWRLVCPHDVDELDEETIEHARSHHQDGGRRFTGDPAAVAAQALAGGLPPPAADAWELPFTETDLMELRSLVTGWAEREDLPCEPVEELVLAVHELATNSIRHGGGAGTMRLWRRGPTLLCEVQDTGTIADPLVGRIQPGTDPASGRGMWIANQMCDLVQIRSNATGTHVRLHKRLA